jgi:hypothetical protein
MLLAAVQDVQNAYFVGWGTLSLLSAGIAQGKNRSGLNWFLITLLLGPLGVLALVLCEKLPPKALPVN